MTSTPLQAVVFDLDGLMFNTEDLYDRVGDILLQRRGHRFTKELKDKIMGLPGYKSWPIFIEHCRLQDTPQELQDESDAIFEEILGPNLQTMPGLVELLAALEQNDLPKAIATSSRRSFVEKVLTPFSYQDRFAFVLSAEDVTEGKPNPEIYLTAAERLGISPAQMMVLEDSQNGCKAAVASGAFAVAVPNHHTQHHDFQGAKLVAETLADVRIYRALGASLE